MQSCTSKSSSADPRGGCTRREDDGFTIGDQRGALPQLQQRLFWREDDADRLAARSDVAVSERYPADSLSRFGDQRGLGDRDNGADGVHSYIIIIHYWNPVTLKSMFISYLVLGETLIEESMTSIYVVSSRSWSQR